jgi:hypothetical protein
LPYRKTDDVRGLLSHGSRQGSAVAQLLVPRSGACASDLNGVSLYSAPNPRRDEAIGGRFWPRLFSELVANWAAVNWPWGHTVKNDVIFPSTAPTPTRDRHPPARPRFMEGTRKSALNSPGQEDRRHASQ